MANSAFSSQIGPTGPTGPTGATGPTGPTGATGASGACLYNSNATDVVANATDTYLTGSDLPFSGNNKIGTIIKWKLFATKTAAGTAVPAYNVRFGTGATVTDVARIATTGVAQTAATDVAEIDIVAVIRATGATTVAAAGINLMHSNGVSGFKNDEGNNITQGTSTAFDSTPASTKVGLSVNPGASGVWTFQVIASELANKA